MAHTLALVFGIVFVLAATCARAHSLDANNRQQTQQQISQLNTTNSSMSTAPPSGQEIIGSSVVRDDELIVSDEDRTMSSLIESPSTTSTLSSISSIQPEDMRSTTVKKELQQVTRSESPVRIGAEIINQAAGSVEPSSLPELIGGSSQIVSSSINSFGGGLVQPIEVSPEISRSVSEFTARMPEAVGSIIEKAGKEDDGSIESLLPPTSSLFNQASVDVAELNEMNCHLRNIDYCLAGLLSTSTKILPEDDNELETRCDEMKAATSCLAIYNKHCQNLKIFSLLAPSALSQDSGRSLFASEQRALAKRLGSQIRPAPELESQLLGVTNSSGQNVNVKTGQRVVSMSDLMELCETEAKNSPINIQLRKRVFAHARCINGRVPKLTPCIEDLKTAVQVFYEPKRKLPPRPTCCAFARFRACSNVAVDNICGFSSFEQLLESMGSSSGGSNPMSMLRTIERTCRQATDHKSAYCQEVLPPSGMRVPHRRGHKASKLAKMLDIFSFAPATQDLSSLSG